MSYVHHIYRPDGTWWMSEHRDDVARTVTTYDELGAVTSTRPYTEAENAEADAALVAAATLTDIAARVARIEAHLWPAPPDPDTPDTVPTMADYAGIWPNGGLIREGGVVWRNVSGVPLTTPPSGFPGGPSQWGHLFVVALAAEPEPDPEPNDAPNWAAGTPYKTGDVVTYNGKVYEVLQAHTSAAHWLPDQVASLYKPL